MNSSFFKNIGSEHGGALLNVMVAVGLGGIVVAGMTQMITNSMKAQKRVSNDVDKSAIKQMLLDVVDCKETLDHCNGTQLSKVYRHRKDGPELFIKNTGTGSRFGFWTLRANCNGTDDGLIVRAARLKEGKSILSTKKSDFQPDPLNNQVYTWNDDQSLLFGDGIEICTSNTSLGNAIVKSGWVSIKTASLRSLERAFITFQEEFKDKPVVLSTTLGCSQTKPTSISQFKESSCNQSGTLPPVVSDITNKGFMLQGNSNPGNGYVGYSWTAILNE